MNIKKWLSSKWHDPVWSKIIAAGIITGCGTGGIWYYYNPFVNILYKVRDYLIETTPVPTWLLLLLILSAIGLFLRAAYLFLKNIMYQNHVEPWANITETVINSSGNGKPGWIVRWENYGFEHPGNIRIFCAKCDFELDFSGGHFSTATSYCQMCRHIEELSVSKREIFISVEKMIQKIHRDIMSRS